MRTPSLLRPLLIGSLAALPFYSVAAEPVAAGPEQAIVPEVQQPELRVPKYASSNFEVAILVGGFGMNYYGFSRAEGARIAYHINEDFFVEAAYDQTDVSSKGLWIKKYTPPGSPQQYSFQGVVPMKSYMFRTGYSGLVPGEVHLFGKYDFQTTGYLFAGLGRVDFNGKTEKAFSVGSGAKLYLTNSIVLRGEMSSRLYTIDRRVSSTKIQRKGIQDGALLGGVSFIF